DVDIEFEEEICKLAVDGQRAAATAITSLATGDFESATQWMLTSHHYDRIIAGKSQQRREQALVPDIFKGLLGPNVGVSEVLGQKSKDKRKEQAKTAKLIEQPKESQTITPKSIQQSQTINLPHFQVTSNHIIITQITFTNETEVEEALSKEIDKASSPRISITTIVNYNNQASSQINNKTNSNLNSRAYYLINKHQLMQLQHLKQGMNESIKLKTLDQLMMTPRARMMMINEQTQLQTGNEGTMPQMMIDLNNVPVPNRLMTRLTERNKIGGKQMITNGAQPEWTSPIAPLLLQQIKQPRQFKGNPIQEQGYQNQLNEELKNGIIKETNSIQVYNPTFIVPRKDGRLRKNIGLLKDILLYQTNPCPIFSYLLAVTATAATAAATTTALFFFRFCIQDCFIRYFWSCHEGFETCIPLIDSAAAVVIAMFVVMDMPLGPSVEQVESDFVSLAVKVRLFVFMVCQWLVKMDSIVGKDSGSTVVTDLKVVKTQSVGFLVSWSSYHVMLTILVNNVSADAGLAASVQGSAHNDLCIQLL
ncbi:MAG: hypothetical protein EZS28_036515, partial [Streblomastix strix]